MPLSRTSDAPVGHNEDDDLERPHDEKENPAFRKEDPDFAHESLSSVGGKTLGRWLVTE